ncbi:MAG: gas vesicle protein GvpG [Candidatus Micrarchaeota archaeon]
MVFIIDDLLYNITISPWLFIFEQIRNHTLREMYPLEKINNQIKENRLLFELGETPKQEYETKNKDLLEKRQMAERIAEETRKVELNIFPRLL